MQHLLGTKNCKEKQQLCIKTEILYLICRTSVRDCEGCTQKYQENSQYLGKLRKYTILNL